MALGGKMSLQKVRTEEEGAGPALPAPLLTTIVAIGLAFAAPAAIEYATPDQLGMFEFRAPQLIAIFAGIRFAVIVGSKTRRLFEMVIWMFVYVFLGIAPMVQMRLGQDTDTAPGIDHSHDWISAFIVLAGCAAFLIGSVVETHRKNAKAHDSLAPAIGVSPVRANILTIVVLGIFAYYVSKVGVANLFQSRSSLDAIRQMIWPDKTTYSMIVGATSMGLLVSTIAQMHIRRQRKAEGQPRPWLLPLLSFVSLFICVNPISSPRYVFGTVLLAMLGAFGAFSTVKRFRVVALSSVFGLVYLFPIADMFRRSLDPTAKSQNPLESMLSGDFDSFSQITNTVSYVNDIGLTWGNQLLGVLFFWVPRSIWPDKAIDTGTMLGEWRGYRFTNLSAPLWAELYINGGWILLVIAMLALGVAVARVDKKSELVLARAGYPTVLACIVPFYLLIILRGSLLQSVAMISIVLAMSYFVRGSRPKVAAKPPRSKLPNAYRQMQSAPVDRDKVSS